jgi:hypothetical protein
MDVTRSRYQTVSLCQAASAKVSVPRKFQELAKRSRLRWGYATVGEKGLKAITIFAELENQNLNSTIKTNSYAPPNS